MQGVPSVIMQVNTEGVYGVAVPREVSYNVPVFILLITASALALFVYLLYYKKTMRLMHGVFNLGALKQLQREGYSFYNFFSLSLFAVYVITVAVFFTFINEKQGWVKLSDGRFILPLSLVFMAFLVALRKITVLLFAPLLRARKPLGDYFFQYSFSVKTEGLLLLPICLLLYYSSVPSSLLVSAGMGLLVFIFLERFLRTAVYAGPEYGFSLFHILLYLCTVEIIPLAVFIKVLAAGWLQFG